MDRPGRPSFERTWALVPLRGLSTAKTRLGPDLDLAARRTLVEALLRRTLVAARDARSLDGTIVVTKDPLVAGIAQAHGAIGLVEHLPGLNEAIDAARSLAVARGATAVLVLPADLPAVSAAAVDALVGAAAASVTGVGRDPERGLVAVVSDRHGRGTNALLLTPPDSAEPAFGAESRAAHRAAAAVTGAEWVELAGPLALDVDTPEDLLVAAAALRQADA
jgi:2-phospho-L-lactate guanylyltransferase